MALRPTDLPKHLSDQHHFVHCGSDAPTYTSTVEYAGVYASLGIDNSLDLDTLKHEMRIEVQSMTKDSMVFDVVGIDAPIANAIRRILLVEVPTMAIEKVWVLNNTSIIQDEVLAHRLGLIPIRADPAAFEERGDNDSNATNTICFRLRAECTRSQEKMTAGDTQPYVGAQVLSSQLAWVPQGEQATQLAADPPRPVHDDILIAKMRPGQAIEVECWCEKGIGRTHAKWSPVATASYRLLPRIAFTEPVTDELASELKALCPMDVFDIEDMGGVPTAVVARPRSCTVCRECVRDPAWAERVSLTRVKDHFIFSVESTGAMSPERLVHDALAVLKQKALDTAQLLKDTLAQNDEGTLEADE